MTATTAARSWAVPARARAFQRCQARKNTWEPIHGVWDPANTSTAAQLLRERIHVIAWSASSSYCDDEIRDITLPFINPALFPEPARAFTISIR